VADAIAAREPLTADDGAALMEMMEKGSNFSSNFTSSPSIVPEIPRFWS
jgi:hypothetical protein